jgi:hypothetical protein
MKIWKNGLISIRKSVGHLHYFMKETALATLVDSGYEIIDFFYTEEFIDLSVRKTIKSKLFYIMHKSLYKMNKDLAVRLFGGVSEGLGFGAVGCASALLGYCKLALAWPFSSRSNLSTLTPRTSMPFLKLLFSRKLPCESTQLVLVTRVGLCNEASIRLWRMASSRSWGVRGAWAATGTLTPALSARHMALIWRSLRPKRMISDL